MKARETPFGGGNVEASGAQREDRQQGDHQERDCALRRVDEIVTDEREAGGEHRESDHHRACVHGQRAIQLLQRLRSQHLIERVVAGVRDQGHSPYEQGTDITELRPRLDHLRQAELRSLRRVEGHEEGADGATPDDGDRGPEEVAAERDAEHADRERGEMGIAGEPDRPEMPYLPVPLRERHVVDRALLEEDAAGHGRQWADRPPFSPRAAAAAPAR